MSTPEAEPKTDSQEAEAKAPPFTTLVLVRHGVTGETGPILSGRRPGIGLSDKGREQAEAAGARLGGLAGGCGDRGGGQAGSAGRRLAELPVAAVYSSPLERCRQTAEAVAAPHG